MKQAILTGEERQELSRTVSAWAKNYFGKGPKNVIVRSTESRITVEVVGFLTPIETTLIQESNRPDLVLRIRESLVESFKPLWRRVLEKKYRLRLEQVEYETDISNNRQIFVFRVKRNTAVG